MKKADRSGVEVVEKLKAHVCYKTALQALNMSQATVIPLIKYGKNVAQWEPT